MKKLLQSIITILILPLISVAQFGTWTLLPNAPETPDRFDDIYFVTDSTGWAVNSQGKIYKTIDAGSNWNLQFTANVYFRSVEFLNADTGFAGTLDGKFFKTTNGGNLWYNFEDSLPLQVDGICGMSHVGNTIYACGIWSTPAYVLKSVDAGTTWSVINLSAYAGAAVDCWFLSEDTGFVSGSSALYGDGVILKTTNGGATWAIKKTVDPGNYVWKLDFLNHQLGYASVEDFLPQNPSTFLKTTDGGETWEQQIVCPQNIDMEGLGFLNDTLGWCGGWSTGMWETKNGGLNWNYVDVGSNFNRFFRVNHQLMYGAGKEIYKYQLEGFPTSLSHTPVTSAMPHTLFPVLPNPFSKSITMKFMLDRTTRVVIEVYGSSGMVYQQKLGFVNEGMHEQQLDLSKLAAGEYFLVLKTNERFLSQQISCQR